MGTVVTSTVVDDHQSAWGTSPGIPGFAQPSADASTRPISLTLERRRRDLLRLAGCLSLAFLWDSDRAFASAASGSSFRQQERNPVLSEETTPNELRMTRRFDAAPERVFAAWLEPELVSKWLFTGPTSEDHGVELDAQVGGRWSITDRREGVDYTASGEYLEIDPPRRLVFTFAMPQFSPNQDTIALDFAPDGAGCLMTFTQSGVDISQEIKQLASEETGGSETGWGWMFIGLDQVLAGSED